MNSADGSALMEARLEHLRSFRRMVAEVAESLREFRKELRRGQEPEEENPIATRLLVEETRLLMALTHADRTGFNWEEEQR